MSIEKWENVEIKKTDIEIFIDMYMDDDDIDLLVQFMDNFDIETFEEITEIMLEDFIEIYEMEELKQCYKFFFINW